MADECESKGAESKGLKRKRKHIRDLNLKDAKQKKIVKSCKRNRTVKKDQTIQPQLPKTATEMSSNWKCLQAVSYKLKLLLNLKTKRGREFKLSFRLRLSCAFRDSHAFSSNLNLLKFVLKVVESFVWFGPRLMIVDES